MFLVNCQRDTRSTLETKLGNMQLNTMIPVTFSYFPCLATMVTPLIGLEVGNITNILGPVFLSFYPVLDPIAIIYFVKGYRQEVFCIFGITKPPSLTHMTSSVSSKVTT
uniref:Gate domain-containing protein n=1 Tax=Heterorhabditis bacteriophora TaxID=37862 RepID=A0A1I7X2B9_HETBA